MVQRPTLGILIAAVFISSGCGSTDSEPTGGEQITFNQEIMGGEIDRESSAVVGLVSSSGYGVGTCSGSLIAPNLVLTAQHCVANIASEYIICGRTSFGATTAARGTFVTTQAYLTNDARNYHEVKEIITAGKDDVCGNDIALLVLADNVPETEATPLVPRIDYPVFQGEEYTAIGYGHTGSGNDSGVRRILDGRRVTCEGDSCPARAQVDAAEFLGSDGTCQGDSGGPAIDRKGRVLGALSRGVGNCESSTYSAVAGWGEWIQEHALIAAEQGGYEPPFWATFGVSEIPENDLDLDGVYVDEDNCQEVNNPDQADTDGDGMGDACDNNNDGDSVIDDDDNCPLTDNDDQADYDSDGLGDACDDDDDDDGVADSADFCPTNAKFSAYGSNCDITGDDLVVVYADDGGGCSTTGASPSGLAGALLMLGLFWRPRRRR